MGGQPSGFFSFLTCTMILLGETKLCPTSYLLQLIRFIIYYGNTQSYVPCVAILMQKYTVMLASPVEGVVVERKIKYLLLL